MSTPVYLYPKALAKHLGLTKDDIYRAMNKRVNPLASLPVGEQGRYRKINVKTAEAYFEKQEIGGIR